MFKNIEIIIVSLLLYWVVASNMPGISVDYGSVGFFLVGILYGLLVVALPEILRFFKFPKNFWGRFLIGSGITLLFFMGLSMVNPSLVKISAGSLGNIDFIWFSIPKIISLNSPLSVGAFLSVFLTLCSIILDLIKKKSKS